MTERIPFYAHQVMEAIPEVGAAMSDTPFLNQYGHQVLALYPELAGWEVQAAAEAYMHCASLLGIDDKSVHHHDAFIPKLREILAAS